MHRKTRGSALRMYQFEKIFLGQPTLANQTPDADFLCTMN